MSVTQFNYFTDIVKTIKAFVHLLLCSARVVPCLMYGMNVNLSDLIGIITKNQLTNASALLSSSVTSCHYLTNWPTEHTLELFSPLSLLFRAYGKCFGGADLLYNGFIIL